MKLGYKKSIPFEWFGVQTITAVAQWRTQGAAEKGKPLLTGLD